MKRIICVLLALCFVLSCFSFVGCDFLQNLAAEEPESPAAVGKWDLVTEGDTAITYLKIAEDGSVDGMFITLINLGAGGDVEYSYDLKRDKIEASYSGITLTIDCKVDGDFLIIDASSLNPDSDPMVLIRHGTDEDVIEYYYDNFDDELWDYDYTYDGPVFSELKYTPPEEFDPPNSSGYYFLKKYNAGSSSDISNIYANVTRGSMGFYDLTSDILEAEYESELGCDVTIEEFDNELTIAGFNAIRIQISHYAVGPKYIQVQYVINIKGTLHSYVLTQPENANWIDKFDESVQNIEAIYE